MTALRTRCLLGGLALAALLLGRALAPAPTPAAPAPTSGPAVWLARLPVHLWQGNPAPEAFRAPMGCGAFATAMALSVYDPARWGTYAAARALATALPAVPVFGGTFEKDNAAAARAAGYLAARYTDGTPADLAALVLAGTPAILLVGPLALGIGQHDVVLAGYQPASGGGVAAWLVDDPALPAGPTVVSAADLSWTGTFTPVWADAAVAAAWAAPRGRPSVAAAATMVDLWQLLPAFVAGILCGGLALAARFAWHAHH